MIRRAAVHGLGYVGLPTAAVFADAGMSVLGVDVNAAAVESINAGQPHIVEPNLEALLHRVIEDGKFRASTTPEPAEVHVIAVPTPFAEDRAPDLSFVRAAAENLAGVLEPGNLVILESTLPVGATEQVGEWLAASRLDLSFPQQKGDLAQIRIAHCPERVLPGQIIHEVVHNPRVIGGMTRRCATVALSFYKAAVQGECFLTNARTAEMVKLTENAFRDVNIAYANELSLICHELRINVWELIELANKHPRVNILRPGPGVGGHCIAVDPWFIIHSAPEPARMIRAARNVNDAKPGWIAAKVLEKVATLKAPTIACLGLAYKPDVDDLRQSPSVAVVKSLLDKARVLVSEPYVDTLPEELAGAELVDLSEAIEAADIVVFLTAHSVFRNIDRADLEQRIVFDTCGILK